MREIPFHFLARHAPDEYVRWFTDARHDLFVWHDAAGELVQFLFCYDKDHGEQAVHWRAPGRLEHGRVDDGERGMVNASPLVVADGAWSVADVRARLERAAEGLDPALIETLVSRLA